VSISDDGFASGGTDPFGCDGTDDNANAVIPVFCQSLAVCGNSVIEPPEACDPPGDPNGNSAFCNSVCQFYDPCVDLHNPPASCDTAVDAGHHPDCASPTCSEAGGIITCGFGFTAAGVACSGGTGWTCNGAGACQPCLVDGDCPNTLCSIGTCDTTLGCQYANNAVGSLCGTDGQCSSDNPSVCQQGDCTDQGVASNTEFVCGPSGGLIKSTLTQCGVCESLGFGCPNDCSGDETLRCGPTALPGTGARCAVQGVATADCAGDPAGPDCRPSDATLCAADILLLGGDGGACTSGLSAACLGCYGGAAACGTSLCAAACADLAPGSIDGPNGCNCIDCVATNCDTDFLSCAGYEQGVPNGTPNPHPGSIGGPPLCEAIPTPDCDN
jgi:hypothetical protein